jgi:uncharacterized protein
MTNMSLSLHEKYGALKNIIKDYGSVAVAFSGGADSTLLLKVARGVLGDKAVAVTARLCFCPERELTEASEFCKKEKITHLFCDPKVMEISGVEYNHPDRCYLCKNEILNEIKKTVGYPNDIKYIIEGSHSDDDDSDRPGFKAVLEHGLKSPLREVGFTKQNIRELSKELGLPTWDKEAFACLATRFEFGKKITEEKLGMIDKAEQLLIDSGFSQIRVRIHGDLARIEVNPEEFAKIIQPEISRKIYGGLKKYGFTYITLDLRGYKTGSMNDSKPHTDSP